MSLRRPNWLAVFMFCSSVALLYFGIPRFLAELMLVPGIPVMENLQKGKPVTIEDLDLLIETRTQAVGFVDHPDAYAQLGMAYYRKAYRLEAGDEKRANLELAVQNLEKALSLRYLDTYSWLYLMHTRHMLGGDENNAKAIEAWVMSVKVAPFEPNLLHTRIYFGILYYKDLSPEGQELLKKQAALAYEWRRASFRKYMRDNKLIGWAVFLLSGDEEAVAYMQQK